MNNFDVAGDNAIKTLGNLNGMTIIFNPDTDFVSGLYASDDGTNWNFDVQMNLASQYGGQDINIGFNVDYSSSGGSTSFDQIGAASRFVENGANYEVHYRTFTFAVPKVYLSNTVNYIRLNVIARRPNVGGNTGIISGGLVRFK